MRDKGIVEAFQNISVNNSDIDTVENQPGQQFGYEADGDEPMVFQAQAQPKVPPKKMRRVLDWKRGRK